MTFYNNGTTVYDTITDQNPLETFTDPGTYNVWLTVTTSTEAATCSNPSISSVTPSPYNDFDR